MARLLLSRGADINAREAGSGRTPLDSAVASSVNPVNSRRMTELLLTAGADVDVRDSSGESALQLAASLGNIDVVRRLLDQGGDPNALGRDTMPLGAAAYQGSPEMVASASRPRRGFEPRCSGFALRGQRNTAVYGAHACARRPAAKQ